MVENYRIEKDENLSPIVILPKTYVLCSENGRLGQEALELYILLVYTALHNDRAVLTDASAMDTLEIGEKKLRRLKDFLQEHGLIRYRRDRDIEVGA